MLRSYTVNFHMEIARLLSYGNYPDFNISIRQLARNGFIYVGRGDIVRCHFCQVRLSDWASDMDVAERHAIASPSCSFVTGVKCDNVPIRTVDSVIDITHAIFDTLIKYNLINHRRPHYKAFRTQIARKNSFPESFPILGEKMAEAGFFFLHILGNDFAVCYWCGGGLSTWKPEDIAEEEHAFYFPMCGYLKITKGTNFASSIRQRRGAATADVRRVCTTAYAVERGYFVAKKLYNEVDIEKQGVRCTICESRNVGVTILPCGHTVLCVWCVTSVDLCPICRGEIRFTLKVYLP